MKVYILEFGQYESTEVLGVFASYELAEEATLKDIREKFGPRALYDSYLKFYTTHEMPVVGV